MFNIRSIKKILIKIRSSFKFILVLFASTVLVVGIISFRYAPRYSVTINGEFIGYTQNKTELQKRINKYIENGDGGCTAFVDVEHLPEYTLCLVRRENETNDDEIYEKVKSSGTVHFEYYAIVQKDEEKYYVDTKEKAEGVLDSLKDKKSSNIDDLAYTVIHSTELKEFTDNDTIISALYKKKTSTYIAYYKEYTGDRIANKESPSAAVLGINLVTPVYGLITSRYGLRGSSTHTGIDVASSTGTTIVAASSGTVTTSQLSGGGYGSYIIISHGNGVQTLYAHCSALYVHEGDHVEIGQAIAAMGSTGNSTGPHLHFEIRIDGTTTDPQNYLYN